MITIIAIVTAAAIVAAVSGIAVTEISERACLRNHTRTCPGTEGRTVSVRGVRYPASCTDTTFHEAVRLMAGVGTLGALVGYLTLAVTLIFTA